ncbi:SidA/IucD/PvdA family monooxygenase [Micromonospora sp. BRA006-A]|nr:SidA/IucD/PvdA family monooxygenase [Micromonospora sp. BRA006-A]
MQTGWVRTWSRSRPDPPAVVPQLPGHHRPGIRPAGRRVRHHPRIEYQQYLVWAAGRLPRITYGTRVDRVEFDGALVSRSGGTALARSRHLVLGSGTVPFVPEFLDALDPRTCSSPTSCTGASPRCRTSRTCRGS